MIVNGSTRICQIIGHPIGQVRSPDLFNAHAAQLGREVVLVPVDIEPSDVASFIRFVRGWRNSDGFLVTVPHKRAVAERLDGLTDRARRLGAVNVVRRNPDGTLNGDMVDGVGCLAAARQHGFDPQGRRALVIGTGGAGSAIVDALSDAGVAELAMRDLDPERLVAMRKMVGAAFPAVRMIAVPDSLEGFDIVVNASPAGMNDTGELPIPAALSETLRPATLVVDVVTKPPMTPFLLAAQACGCRVQTGPEMVMGQLEILGRFMQAWD